MALRDNNVLSKNKGRIELSLRNFYTQSLRLKYCLVTTKDINVKGNHIYSIIIIANNIALL